MTKARDAMTKGAEFLKTDDTVKKAAEKMASADVGALPICNSDGRLQGMVTDRDIAVKVVAKGMDPASTRLSDLTDGSEVVTIGADDSIDEAVRTMKQHRVRRLPVIDGDKVVGMLSQGDVAINLSDNSKVGDLVEAISAAP